MRQLALVLMAALVGGLFVSPCLAQSVVVYDPVIAPAYVYSSPVNVYSPAPLVAYRPIAPVYRYRYRRFAPAYAYGPAYTVPYATRAYYPPVYVRPRFFVPGQPVRNYYRAVLP